LHDRSGAIYWGELDNIVEDCHREGVKVLLSMFAVPSWATPNGRNGLPSREHFGTFAYFTWARWRNAIAAKCRRMRLE
jgi:hypothetical protein